MSAIDIANAKENSFVLLQIGNRRVALPAAHVAELAPPVRLHTFPHTTPLLAGVIVRRGRIVPVFDTEPVLGGKIAALASLLLDRAIARSATRASWARFP